MGWTAMTLSFGAFRKRQGSYVRYCALLGYYAASSNTALLTVSGQPIGPAIKYQESWDFYS